LIINSTSIYIIDNNETVLVYNAKIYWRSI